jgi:hypothetical protein
MDRLWLLACQIAHNVTSIRIRSSFFIVSIMKKSHCLAAGSVESEMCSVTSSSDNAQTHRAKLHSCNECIHESSCPQIEHAAESAILRRCLTSLVSRECCASLHKKWQIFDGTAIFHSMVYSLLSSEDDATRSPSMSSRVRLIIANIR